MAGVISQKPMCKYGSKCYRKNPEHLQEFSHPDCEETSSLACNDNSNNTIEIEQPLKKKTKLDDYFRSEIRNKEENEKKTEPVASSVPKERDKTSDGAESNSGRAADDSTGAHCPPSSDPESDIKEKFLVQMPADFYEFWQLAKSINKTRPAKAFASSLGLRLVGPYDLLSGDCPIPKSYLCHYRYFYDPPEFQTILAGDEKTQFHIGYFRDDPNELPVFLSSNEAKENCLMKPCGPNIFAAINDIIARKLKTGKSDGTLKSLQAKLAGWAGAHDICLQLRSETMKKRAKKVVTRTFHGAGLVVPVDENEVGYRTLSETPGELKKILAAIASSNTPAERDTRMDPLTDVVTNIQFANDEGDYGAGIELGLDIFCSGNPSLHPLVLSLLPMGYRLVGREAFAQILVAHLQDRSRSLRSSECVTHL